MAAPERAGGRAVRIAVLPASQGDPASWTLAPLPGPGEASPGAATPGAATTVVAADLPSTLLRGEHQQAPRWVWSRTTEVYPAVVAAGVRLARCHDLDATRRLLLAHESRWSELEKALAGSGSGSGSGSEATLFDVLDHADVADRAARQGAPGQPRTTAHDHDRPGGDALAALAVAEADQGARIAAAGRAVGGFNLLVAAESASALLAVEMGHDGLPWDAAAHEAILVDLLGPRPSHGRPPRLQALAAELAHCLDDPALNPDSPADLLRSLRRAGLPVTSTNRRELGRHDHPALPVLRRYKELARLWTAHGWTWQETWVRGGRFRPEYVPAGVVSGRWATRGGGALQIPKAVRGAVRAQDGRVLVVADAGQLEPRVLAAISGDSGMVAATRAGDLYADLAERALGRSEARAEAKLALLSAMYGGGSAALVALRRRFPQALALLEDAARAGEDGASVRSVLGRTCPPARSGWLDGLSDAAAGERRRARGRFTRNFLVQASAADWAAVWLAVLRRRLAALGDTSARLVFFQHDEVIVEADEDRAGEVVTAIGEAGAEASGLVLGDVAVQIPLLARPVASYADTT